MPPKLKRVSADSLHKNNISEGEGTVGEGGVGKGCVGENNIKQAPDSRQHDFGKYDGPTEQQQNIQTYLSSLSELEQRVCDIAKDHLKSSFDLSRSSGFVAWKAKNM